MKQLAKGFLMFMLTLGAILALGFKLEAQNKYNRVDSNLLPAKKKEVRDDIKLNVKVLFDNLDFESNSVKITIQNLMENTENTTYITDNFKMFLKRETYYCIILSHHGYNERKFLINTTCPNDEDWTINLTMRLYSDKPNDIAGVIYYDTHTLNFETKPFPKQ